MEKKFRIVLLLVSLSLVPFLDSRAQEDQEIDEENPLVLSLIMGPSELKAGTKGELTVFTDGGVEPFTYKWSDGREGEGLSKLAIAPTKDTVYTVTVIDSSYPPVVKTSKPFKVRVVDSPKDEEDGDDEEGEDDQDEEEDDEDETDEPDQQEPVYVAPIKAEEEESVDQSSDAIAALTIEGKKQYQMGDVIQLVAKPEGLAYQWSGPASFASTAQRISLFATPEAAGTYTVEARSAGRSLSAQANITVKQKTASPIVQLPVPVAPVIARAEQKRESVGVRSEAFLTIKTGNYKVVNDEVSFTVTVTNRGKKPATNVLIADVVPQCCTLVRAEGVDWAITSEGNQIQAWLDYLPVHQRKSITITVRFVYEPTDTPYNVATVTSDGTGLYESYGRLG